MKFRAYDLVDEQTKKMFYLQKHSVQHVTGLFRLRVLGFGLLTSAILLICLSFLSDIGENEGSFHCWDTIPFNYIDETHPKGFRTIITNELDTNSLIITGRNHPHVHQSSKGNTFTIHAHLESTDIIVADFSPIGGAPALHGQCLKSNGDIKWTDGVIWKRGIKLSELILTTNHLSILTAAKIKEIYHQHEEKEKKLLLLEKQSSSTAKPIEIGRSELPYSQTKSLTDEGVIEPVTLADIESNQIFIKGLKHRFPGLTIFTEEEERKESEEGEGEGRINNEIRRKRKNEEDQFYNTLLQPLSYLNMDDDLQSDPVFPIEELLITIDPLDATKEFTENLLNYVTTQQCVVHKGRPILGVIHQPFETIQPTTAMPSLQQVLGGRTGKETLIDKEDNVVIISRSHSGEAENIIKKNFIGKKILKAGGAGYKALAVQNKVAELYFHATKTKVWDVCAPTALFQALGGKASDTLGNDLIFNTKNPVLVHGFLGSTSTDTHGWYLDRMKNHEIDLSSKQDAKAVPKGATLLKGSHS